MTKRMMIDATHGEETRVVVLDGTRLEDFDVETATKRQLKGNIYLAKVVRVEPSLQAAFVEYGGGRHGFLAFGEIHPDYYQIPVADRQRLLRLQAEEARAEAEAEDAAAGGGRPAPVARDRGRARTASPAEEGAPADEPLAGAPATGEEAPARTASAEDEGADTAPDPDPDTGSDAPEAALAAPDGAAAGSDRGEPEWRAEPAAPEDEPPAGPRAGAAADHDGDEHPPRDADDAAVRPAQPALIARQTKFGPARAPSDDGAAGGAPAKVLAAAAGEADGWPAAPPGSAPAEEAASAGFSGFAEEATDFDVPRADVPPPETIGGDAESDGADEARERRSYRFLRNYRIQEVIRRRQIMLVQVVKEERGTKGAALTTYISLAGRFCVLMPNSPRGGGISRKITAPADRRRLKEVVAELDLPDGMGLIVRTDAANRPKPEIKRDCEYLMRLWDDIRELTLRSVAPALIYEEASLIKRAIRDVYSRDVDEILVDGEEGWRAAHDFMRMLMPSHAKKVVLWKNGGQPLFSKFGVEAQLDAMLSPTVQLRSGGYLVIGQTEALVAIDVNSGRSTRERGIEETALRTNLEAADEVARQLRLRDLAGLIVIDFIDMEAKKHNAMVERRLKEALKVDRARIQVGHISHFGLLEMSRQRLRPSLAETSFVACPHCGGLGHVRGIDSSAIHVLRAIEEEGAKGRAALITVYLANPVLLYVVNHKRDRLAEIEARCAMRVHFAADDTLVPPQIRIDRTRPQLAESERPLAAIAAPVAPLPPPLLERDTEEDEEDGPVAEARAAGPAPAAGAPAGGAPAAGNNGAVAEEAERRRRRRRRRRGVRRDAAGNELPRDGAAPGDAAFGDAALDGSGDEVFGDDGADDDGPPDLPGEVSAVSAEDAAEGSVSAPDDAGAPARAGVPPANGVMSVAAFVADVVSADPAAAEQPSLDPEELDENGLPRPTGRRRGRRGGRRRPRRDGAEESGGEALAESDAGAGTEVPAAIAAPAPTPDEPAPAPTPTIPAPTIPAYDGPTPANPFGGGAFDIFDLMDRAEAEAPPPPPPRPRRAAAAPPPPAAPVAVEPELPFAAPPPAPPLEATPETPAAIAAEAAEPEPTPEEPRLAEAVAVTEVPIEPAPEPDAAPEPPAPVLIQPVVVDAATLAAAPRKQGYWRR